MILEHTRLVTPENGPRPNGKPDECFYCNRLVGQPHKDNCVIFSKVVMVKVAVVIPRAVPAHWEQDQIEFQMNEGSYGNDSLIHDLERHQAADKFGCLCPGFTAEVLRDATTEDLAGFDLTKFT